MKSEAVKMSGANDKLENIPSSVCASIISIVSDGTIINAVVPREIKMQEHLVLLIQ